MILILVDADQWGIGETQKERRYILALSSAYSSTLLDAVTYSRRFMFFFRLPEA